MSPFIGQLMIVPYNFAPRGWAYCAGQLLSIAQNTALFSLLGTTYGGNGTTTFALPNLQGRIPMGQGTGPGLSTHVMGEVSGTETTTLTTPTMAAHGHGVATTGTLNAVDVKATDQSPPSAGYAARPVDGAPAPDMIPRIYLPAAAGDPATKVPLAGVNVAGNTGITGGNTPFSTLQPYLAIAHIIALEGIYPSRN